MNEELHTMLPFDPPLNRDGSQTYTANTYENQLRSQKDCDTSTLHPSDATPKQTHDRNEEQENYNACRSSN